MNKIKDNKAITLVALIITVIVMLILAGVSISVLTGGGGLFEKTTSAAEEYNQSVKNEADTMQSWITEIDKQISPNLPVVANIADGNWNATKGMNSPKLGAGMSAFYFDGSEEVSLSASSSIEEWNKWYDYSASKWANAKTDDGSYWVWVPRYAYKITSNYQTAFADGNQPEPSIDIVFLDNNNRNGETQYNTVEDYEIVDTSANYYVHPAFINDSGNAYTNGGWSSDLAGIWVAKFEASNTGSKPVSLPNKASWTNISIGTMYNKALNYKSGLESHLMKNSEWGATAYLGHSKYGLNGKNIAVNTTSYTTGAGSAWATTNVGQSTTGNVTGVYDMSGCTWEYIAGYVANGSSKISSYGASFASTELSPSSSKYVTVYKQGTSDTSPLNYNANFKKGDAIRETSNTGESSTSWYGGYSYFPYSSNPFFACGGHSGNGTSAGLFCFYYDSGISHSNSGFRVTLAV